MDLYAEEIISHYEHPHNKGKLDAENATFHEHNPLCGDEITIHLHIDNGRVDRISFEGNGCAISMGTASMLTDFIKGKTLEEVEKMGVSTVIDLLGIDPGPGRLKCATLSLKTLKEAIFVYEHKSVDSGTRNL
ncbi:MAG: SUF system NifU family Fe-S cluster assembly protein [Candidatus Micrarchaeota archaeon]|nr:SUF system NifU family Fe-S cluster assembly protein [Candidatus Micrarchaeota archaeon]